MKQTTFEFTVEFKSDDPFGDHDLLLKELEAVQGVEAVDSTERLTVRCPVGKLVVRIHFEDAKQAERLYTKLTRLITTQPDVSLWGRGFIPSDIVR